MRTLPSVGYFRNVFYPPSYLGFRRTNRTDFEKVASRRFDDDLGIRPALLAFSYLISEPMLLLFALKDPAPPQFPSAHPKQSRF